MTLLTRDEIERLAVATDGPRVSLYLPTHRAGRETAQDPIRFKNLLTAADRDLVARGVRAPVAQDLLRPARDLLDDRHFWLHQADGLAVFVSSDQMETYRLPLQVEELETVADHFHVKPLLRLLSGDGRFYVLAVSQHRVRLFEAGRDAIRELDLGDVPKTLQDAVGYDWEERSLQFHTGTGPSQGGRRSAMFHGHGSPQDDEKEEVATFLRLVDDGVVSLLRGEHAPMVLAGVGRVMATYRALTKYPQVLADGVEGNPDRLSLEELHERAWPVVAPRFASQQREAAERYADGVGSGRTSGDLTEVLRAAFDGRVEVLFVATGVPVWGRFDPTSRRTEIHQTQHPGDRDLLDLASVQSLVTNADVYLVDPERVPDRGAVAAVFRY